MTNDKEREAFEAWQLATYPQHIARWGDTYQNAHVRCRWEGFQAGRASLAASAGSEPVVQAGAAVLCWVNEDELPEGLTQEAYSALFPHSKVAVVRMFPVFGPTAQAAPAGAGTWAHLKLMMEESAWDGTLQLSDALANIDDFAAAHPSPPEGAGWISVDERLPEPGMPVLLDIGKKYPIRAMWAPAKTLEASNDSDAVGDYDEATDTYYCPEGWYEWNQHEETHWFVTETPRAWAPLPLPAPPASEAKGA